MQIVSGMSAEELASAMAESLGKQLAKYMLGVGKGKLEELVLSKLPPTLAGVHEHGWADPGRLS